MVRIQSLGQFRADTNATYGEDGASAAASFVPKLGRLGRLSGDWDFPSNYVVLDPPSDPAPNRQPPAAPAAPVGTKLPTSTLLLAGGGLLAFGVIIYLVARPS